MRVFFNPAWREREREQSETNVPPTGLGYEHVRLLRIGGVVLHNVADTARNSWRVRRRWHAADLLCAGLLRSVFSVDGHVQRHAVRVLRPRNRQGMEGRRYRENRALLPWPCHCVGSRYRPGIARINIVQPGGLGLLDQRCTAGVSGELELARWNHDMS